MVEPKPIVVVAAAAAEIVPNPASVELASMPIGVFLSALGAKSPTPGGGAVAAMTGATGAALARMEVRYSLGKKNLAEHQPALESADAALQRFEALLLGLGDEDAAAYGLVNELQKLPESDARRRSDLPAAEAAALSVPRAVLAACCDLLRMIETLAPMTNKHLRSDLAIAAVLAEAGAKSAWWNVRVNLSGAPVEAERIRAECVDCLEDAAGRRAWVEGAMEG